MAGKRTFQENKYKCRRSPRDQSRGHRDWSCVTEVESESRGQRVKGSWEEQRRGCKSPQRPKTLACTLCESGRVSSTAQTQADEHLQRTTPDAILRGDKAKKQEDQVRRVLQ